MKGNALALLDSVWQFAPGVYISFLGCVDKIGIAFEAPTISTGFGAYLAQVRVSRLCYVLDCIMKWHESRFINLFVSRLLGRWVSRCPVDGYL